ncbi:VCBS domain-containing protein [Afipia sp. GAS231]|uniref:VCBS domain-containing protein n=1 Tax=Afipia sp. GAS231 TaxID=1882747 RepID=UPI00087D80D9|nr:VCBS domain-containing protein [Afipia sp. GAS231]SDP31521.1 FecR family protein [Afipia sp. GAS231]
MLVASGVEFGDACTAAAGQLPQVIGNIQTAIGCGTIKRPGGVAVQVMVGDPVCQDDVIETEADGRIEIRFVDGTVFNLSPDTRVVLSEFARDSNGTLRSALLAVTRGTFAFIAGRLAMAGSLTVDTSVGSIRSLTQGGGIGMLSSAALIFSAMKEVQAADSNVTFLDDDTITYKDLEHGVFELITKEAIPRHIIVEDPGETVVLSRSGSSVSVNEVANSLTRMQELRAAQQDVLANFAKGLGPTGSSTPPFVNPLPVEPINFIQTDALHPQNLLPPIEPMIFTVPESNIVRLPPTLNASTGPTEIDTVVFDSFTTTSGIFSASSANGGAALTFGISGGTAGNTVLGGVTYDVSSTGPFGTLYVDSTTGAYTFAPNSDAINALQAPTTETFTITVSDGTLSASQAFTININGVNDAAIISGTTTGSAVEAGGVANATAHTPTATGTLTDTDVDNPPNTFTAVTSPTASAGGYGTFTMTAAGVWTYTINEANGAVQALNVGDALTDSFTVTTIDGTPQVVTIVIHGANDAAIISGATTGSVIEASCHRPDTPTATGTLTDTDVDNPPNTFAAVTSPTASAGGYGTFTMTTAGVWTYKLDNDNGAVQALNVGEKLTDTFTVTTIDGTPQVVTITINGTNDAAIISGKTTGSVTAVGDDDDDAPGMPRATGRLTDTDVDNPPNTFMPVSSPTKGDGGYGTFTMTAAGVWTYTLDDTNYAVRALDADDKLTDTFTVHTIDGTAQVVTITIHGASDDDRDDFDHLVTGTHVVADPPFADGIPQHDSIAVGGTEGQIIDAGGTASGSGKADLLSAGSGNDTINRAGTISGGSEIDTIDTNSGNGTHLGGHGPDPLTGGNGNDRFVFSSAAESRAVRFDTISDFRSGFGRMDLSALGALDFVILALPPASTSVPAHTIAWLYDSANNETIVYVNPTDQTLRIGASSLLEIHVQGVATIQASDFAPEPTVAAVAMAGEPVGHESAATVANDAAIATMATALVSSGTTISDDAHLAVSHWTWHTTEEKLIISSFDEGRTPATEHTDDAVAILSGHSIGPLRGLATEPMKNDVTFDKTPVHDGNGAVTPPSGTINNTDVTALKTPAEPSHVENGAKPEGGGPQSHSDENIASETNDVATASHKVHSNDHSRFEDHSASKDHSDLKEHSELAVTDTGPADAAETHMHRSETAGKLVMGDSFKFRDELPGHKAPDVIDRGHEDHTPTSIGHHENSAGHHGLLEISEAQTIELSPSGQHSADHFSIDPHHAGSVVVSHGLHDLIV